MIFWIFFLILSLIVEVYLWWKLQASLIFLSGRTCTIGGWLNTFLPHCIYGERKRGGIFCYWFNWKNWLNNAFKESLKILSAPKQVKESCFKGQNRHHSGTNQQSQVERYKIMLAKANWIINAILIMTITTDASTEQLVGLLRCSFHWSSKIQSSLGFMVLWC